MPYDEANQITCPYGDQNCVEDDFDSMCDECKSDRAQERAEGMMDTYD